MSPAPRPRPNISKKLSENYPPCQQQLSTGFSLFAHQPGVVRLPPLDRKTFCHLNSKEREVVFWRASRPKPAMESTPKRRSALETRTNVTGRSEKSSHKPHVTPQPTLSHRSRLSMQAAAALPHDVPKEARSAQSIRREQGLTTWMNFVFAPGGSASGTAGSALSLHQVEQQRQETVLRARMAISAAVPSLGHSSSKSRSRSRTTFCACGPPST